MERSEIPQLDIFISILSEPEAMQFSSEEDLLRQIRPGVDGLILVENGYKGTFYRRCGNLYRRKSSF
ncbi:AMMECR1 domain-containing protein [methane-oxidizing endosymbiont of Gigantopelta aegis]|uniref:AMMECR1 domain-containing protein n=1 Tax=methane-oxidizing endosymbiont of Gigantopelta aegis TaxID=2794938 RepID=UPI00315B3230